MELVTAKGLDESQFGKARSFTSPYIWTPMAVFAGFVFLAIAFKEKTWHRDHSVHDLDIMRYSDGHKNVTCHYRANNEAPCYKMLFSEVYHTVFWFDVFPLTVVLAAIYSYHPKLAFSECIRRWQVYPLLLVIFFVWRLIETIIEFLIGIDASDHVSASMISLLIAFLEVDFLAARYQTAPKELVLCVAGLVLLMKSFFAYNTVLYFHTETEAFCGLAVGTMLVAGILHLCAAWEPLSWTYAVVPS